MFKLKPEYENISWYGAGPMETYSDRLPGAKIDLFEGKVANQLAKYLSPQESGNKSHVRFAKLTDKKGRGLIVAGNVSMFQLLPIHQVRLKRQDMILNYRLLQRLYFV